MKIVLISIIILSITFVSIATDLPSVNGQCNINFCPQYNNTAMRISIQPISNPQNPMSSQDRQIHLRFFDANTNNPIENVTFSMKITKANQTLLYNAFYSKSGNFTLILKPGERYLWSANPDHDPMNGLYYSQGDQIEIDTSYITKGFYYFEFQPLVYVVDKSKPNDGLKFEAGLTLFDNSNYHDILFPVSNMPSDNIAEFPFAIPILLMSIVSIIVFYRIRFDSQR